MNTYDFNSMQAKAIQQAKEMNNRSKRTDETPFCRHACPIKNILSPVTGEIDSDIILLTGLLLLLSKDGGDRMLMFALLYIMT